ARHAPSGTRPQLTAAGLRPCPTRCPLLRDASPPGGEIAAGDEGPIDAVAALLPRRHRRGGKAELGEFGGEQSFAMGGRIEPALDRLLERMLTAGDVLADGAVIAGGGHALAQRDAEIVRQPVLARH